VNARENTFDFWVSDFLGGNPIGGRSYHTRLSECARAAQQAWCGPGWPGAAVPVAEPTGPLGGEF